MREVLKFWEIYPIADSIICETLETRDSLALHSSNTSVVYNYNENQWSIQSELVGAH